MKLKTFARIAGFLLTLPALGADTSVRTLYDSDLDGWRLWTAYGPAVNERYGGTTPPTWSPPARPAFSVRWIRVSGRKSVS